VKKTVIRCVQLSLSVVCLGCVASGGTVNIGADVNGSTAVAWALNASTTGASMAGLITISVNGGAPVLWTTNVGSCTSGIGCGQATGAIAGGAWTLQVIGDPGAVGNFTMPEQTALNPWTLTNTSTTTPITSVVISGNLSNSCFASNANLSGCINGIVFDRDRATAAGANSGGQEGTPGGSFGITYTFSAESGANKPFTANVTYSNILALAGPNQGCNGATFAANSTVTGCGDEWAKLTFTFSGNPFQATTGGGGGNAVWSFFQDTDAAVAPEPLTWGLMGAGLFALAALRKRRVCGAFR